MTVRTAGGRRTTPSRAWPLGLALTAVLAAAAPALAAAPVGTADGPGPAATAARAAAPQAAPAALRAPLPDGLGPCVPGSCPPFWPEPNNLPYTGRDNAVNVFVGDDFNVRRGAAEAEGRVVVLGDFDMEKLGSPTTSDVYNIGIAGVGSRVPPENGTDFLTVGGSIRVATGQRLLADGGVVRYAGTLTGTVTGALTQDPGAALPYAGIRARLTAAGKCYARVDGQPRPATGTVAVSPTEALFTGDGSSPLQVFNVPAGTNLATAAGGQVFARFTGIPDGATVLVNVLGDDPLVSFSNGSYPAGLRHRLLWNFPDAGTVRLHGSGTLEGSTLVAEPSSETSVQLPGVNGRFFTAGDLTHTGPSTTGGFGQEFHAYPFTGSLPDCGTEPPEPVEGSLWVAKTDEESGAALAGARFQLWRETNGTAGLQTDGATPDEVVSAECVTADDGRCGATVPPGTYYWRETQAPDGYEPPASPVSEAVVLTADNAAQGVTTTVRNTREEEYEGSIRVLKKDAKTKRPLRGAVFEVWRETNGTAGLQTLGINPDRRIGEGCATDSAGVCEFGPLSAGRYYLWETDVPEAYVVPDKDVHGPLTLDASTPGHRVEVTVFNKRDDHGKDPSSSTED
ncbi:choice-of-anchor A family protein [Streptomyces sp. NPDC089799]|uniref:choice-of-anchor A family protein n=1 Tax=Streptomyces sp. NPDC089799 TaxID=3155066 RepID=UPI0034373371